jgi:hypothetical protein
MRKLVSALVFGALALAGIVVIAYGSIALVFPLLTLFLFFMLFLGMALEAYYESERTPGIEKLQEPDWGSLIHNTWLFKTNIEAWAEHTATISLLVSALLSTMMGAVLLLSFGEAGPVAYVSWLTGLFLTGTIAAGIATAEHWAKKAEAARI